MISWSQWCSVLAISRHGTFAKASIPLGIDATTLARRLKSLEDQLGYELFLRGDGKLHPTSQCEELLSHIETADDALRQATQVSANSDDGTLWRELRMTAPPFLVNNVFAPAVGELAKRRNIKIEMLSTSNSSILTRREADISVRIDDHPKNFRTEYERIEAKELGTLTYAIYAPVDTESDILPWAGLTEPLVATSGSKAMLKSMNGDVVRFKTKQFDAVRELTALTPARAMLPDLVAGIDPRLERVSDTVLSQPLWMLYHKQDRDVPHLRAARDWIVQVMKATKA